MPADDDVGFLGVVFSICVVPEEIGAAGALVGDVASTCVLLAETSSVCVLVGDVLCAL